MKIDHLMLADFKGHIIKPINGRQLNYLDYSQHCNKYDEVQNLLLVEDKLGNNIFQNYFMHPSINKLRKVRSSYRVIRPDYFENPESEILVTDFTVLYTLLAYDIELCYKHIVVTDCLELTLFMRDLEIPSGIEHMFHDREEIMAKLIGLPLVFLATDYNKKDIEDNGFKFVRYYRKINFDLFDHKFLRSLPKSDELVFYYSYINEYDPDFSNYLKEINAECPDIKMTTDFMDVFKHKHILYAPKPYVGYIEQFGRMFFELEYLGYTVHIAWCCKKEEKTGMDFYFDYYMKSHNDINLSSENFLEVVYNAVQ